MLKIFFYLCLFLSLNLSLALVPSRALSAEVLQVKSSSIVQVGDQNRTYKVKLACIHVEPSKEELATNWLASELPRHSRVNLLPKGFDEGILLSKVIDLNSNNDVSKSMIDIGLANSICN